MKNVSFFVLLVTHVVALLVGFSVAYFMLGKHGNTEEGAVGESRMSSPNSEALAVEESAFPNETKTHATVPNTIEGSRKQRGQRLDSFREMARSQPEQAVNAFLKLRARERHPRLIEGVFTEWARTDAQGALNYLRSHGETLGEQQYSLINQVMGVWAESQPQEVFAFIESIEDESERETFYSGLMNTLIVDDFETALVVVGQLPRGYVHEEAVREIARVLADENPRQALTWVVNNAAEEQKSNAAQIVIQAVAQTEPKVAASLIDELAEGTDRAEMVNLLASHWGSEDPKAAFNWLADLKHDDGLESAYQIVMQNYLTQSLDDASALIVELSDGPMKNDLVMEAARMQAERDVSAALEWSEQLGTDQARLQALSGVMDIWIANDSNAALQYAAGLPNSQSRDSMLTSAVNQVAGSNPQLAAQYLNTLPQDGQAWAAREVMASWLNDDPNAAVAWAQGITESAVYDGAVQGLVDNYSQSHPRYAFDWALQVKQPEKRLELLKQTVAGWGRMDPDEAKEAVGQLTGLTAQDIESLNALIPSEQFLVLPD